LLGGDVLFFVNLPYLILAFVGETGVLGLLDSYTQLFKLRGKPSGGLRGRVVLASEILLDIVLQMRINNLGRELRILSRESDLDQAAVGHADNAQASQKRTQNCGAFYRRAASPKISRRWITAELRILRQIHARDGLQG